MAGAPEHVSAPQQACVCGAPLRDGTGLLARVLMLDRWHILTHMPKYCAKHLCARHNTSQWCNITVCVVNSKKETHWHWPGTSELEYFFVSPELGCSTAWLRQFHARQHLQFASSRGEADVFVIAALREGAVDAIPKDARSVIQRLWMAWRLMIRVHDEFGTDAEGRLKQPFDIARPHEEMVADVLPWYRPMMRARRVAAARAASGGEVKTIAMDGNQKITRRICGRPCAQVLNSPELGLSIATKCGDCPAWKKDTCACHAPVTEGSRLVESAIAGLRVLPAGSSRSHLYEFAVPGAVFGRARNIWLPPHALPAELVRAYWDKLVVERRALALASAESDLAVTR